MTRLVIIVVLLVLCMGQGFGPKIVKGPIQRSGAPGPPSDPSGANLLKYWWVASDIPTNTAIGYTVTNWIDRIQSSLWTNANSSIAPTTDGTNVIFTRTSSQYLTNRNAAVGGDNSANSIAFILSPTSLPGNASILHMNPSAGTPAFWLQSTGNFEQEADAVDNNFGKLQTGIITDMIITFSGNANCTAVSYTNGVQSVSLSISHNIHSQTLSIMGGGAFGYYNGKMYELLLWTNIVLNATQRSNVHYYATNTYRYSP